MFIFFKINQSSIQELFCVNKEKPELKCEGKCHLNAQIAEANDKDSNKNAPALEQLEWHINSLEIEDYFSLNQELEVGKSIYLSWLSALLYQKIPHPPQLLA